MAKLIYDLYPTSSHLYLYRHPAEYVRSLITVYKSLLHPLARSLMLYLAFDFSMYDFIMRQFLDTEQRYSSIYEAKMVDSLQHINLRRYVKRFAALFSGNLLAMLQLQKEENIPMCMISYHELKVSKKKLIKNHKKSSIFSANFCAIFFNHKKFFPHFLKYRNIFFRKKKTQTKKCDGFCNTAI